jgi:hypothetical protein
MLGVSDAVPAAGHGPDDLHFEEADHGLRVPVEWLIPPGGGSRQRASRFAMTRHATDPASQTVASSYGAIRMPVGYRVRDSSPDDVSPSCATQLLVRYGPVPAPMHGNRALVGVGFFAYRDSDLGAYLEVGLSIFARMGNGGQPFATLLDQLRPLRRRRSGWTVLDLPVTTERACVVGRECWGLPKFVTEITFEMEERRFTGKLEDPDGATICTLRGTLGAGPRIPSPDAILYTLHHGSL